MFHAIFFTWTEVEYTFQSEQLEVGQTGCQQILVEYTQEANSGAHQNREQHSVSASVVNCIGISLKSNSPLSSSFRWRVKLKWVVTRHSKRPSRPSTSSTRNRTCWPPSKLSSATEWSRRKLPSNFASLSPLWHAKSDCIRRAEVVYRPSGGKSRAFTTYVFLDPLPHSLANFNLSLDAHDDDAVGR